ncbi:hypothetical protein [Halalkalibacter alkalisediminis]|uniref:hypothetical protein n=1 Tax=Halalkalibacter alkalisediminis TaxID=935616 RepID=UPI00236065FB|nr:hypothetical protein [Halalkalibacter alkalisediminis]
MSEGRPAPGYSITKDGKKISDEQIKEWLLEEIEGDEIIRLMKDQLTLLNQGFEENNNQQVVITTKNNKGWIQVSPLEKQPDPRHLALMSYGMKRKEPLSYPLYKL